MSWLTDVEKYAAIVLQDAVPKIEQIPQVKPFIPIINFLVSGLVTFLQQQASHVAAVTATAEAAQASIPPPPALVGAPQSPAERDAMYKTMPMGASRDV